MKILNFGSLNIDHVYKVEDFVRPGETISALSYEHFCGGKGANQSLALARAGAHVFHGGKIGQDGLFIKNLLETDNVDCRYLEISDTVATGHAMIQVSSSGENCIVLFGGANTDISLEHIKNALAVCSPGDILLLQNEINNIASIIDLADQAGLKIFFNPAPFNEQVLNYPLDKIDTFIVNEIEGSELAGTCSDMPEEIMDKLQKDYPSASFVITLGAKGAMYRSATEKLFVPPCKVDKVVDTTAAGDTFIGYFIASLCEGCNVKEAMENASKASAVCISRKGAGISIPRKNEL